MILLNSLSPISPHNINTQSREKVMRGFIVGRIFASEIWGAYFWESLICFSFLGRGVGIIIVGILHCTMALPLACHCKMPKQVCPSYFIYHFKGYLE